MDEFNKLCYSLDELIERIYAMSDAAENFSVSSTIGRLTGTFLGSWPRLTASTYKFPAARLRW